MATLKTNTLTGTSTAGSIAVTGEGNSTTTNLQQGLCKVWVNMNAGTTINDSQNVSGLTDVATGAHTITFSNNMASANYSPSMNGKEGVGETHSSAVVDVILNPTRVVFTTSDIKVTSQNFNNQLTDFHTNTVNIMGDLA
tara:strand:- start:399 stop:818 length:420 start_codon:yes stop_codon:yes gene_type:complete